MIGGLYAWLGNYIPRCGLSCRTLGLYWHRGPFGGDRPITVHCFHYPLRYFLDLCTDWAKASKDMTVENPNLFLLRTANRELEPQQA